MPGFGWVEMLVLLGIVVILFGAKKLPQLGGAIGESIKNFKKGVKDDETKKLEEGSGSSGSSTKKNDHV